MEAPVQCDQIVTAENNPIIMEAPIQCDPIMIVENDPIVTDKDDQTVSIENDQLASVESDKSTSVVNDANSIVPNDESASFDKDQVAGLENNQVPGVENDDQLATSVDNNNQLVVKDEIDQIQNVENDQIVSFENYQIVHSENDQIVSFENDDVANMDTDELVNHHNHQLVTIAETHQLVPFQNNQLESVEYNPLATIENEPIDDVAAPIPKRRKKKSTVWEHFTIENVNAGCRRACCKQCKQSFAYSTGSKVAGTSHLKRHVAKGTCSVLLRTQAHNISAPPRVAVPTSNGTDPPKRRYRTASSMPYIGFDPDRCYQELSKMIIMHDYPLHMVEHKGFVAFVKSLQPRFVMPSFETVQNDCLSTHLKEKQTLQKAIELIPGKISLTLDMYSSNSTTGYVFLTGSYIDTDWKLHRKVLNVVMEPYPESDSAFSHAVAYSLSDWNIEGKLFSLTLNQPLSDCSYDNLRALLAIRNPVTLNGELLVKDCLARTLSSVARASFMAVDDTVKKVRDSVKYVKLYSSREDKFFELKQQLQVPSTKSLALDDENRWDTTYEMLVSASELREVFSCLDTSDPDYREAPSLETWKKVETLLVFLKTPYETATNLSDSKRTPTSNAYFHEVWKMELELVRGVQNKDPFVSTLAKAMKTRFEKYWQNCSLVLASAIVMDPRFKMKIVEFSFSKIYGEDSPLYVKLVDEGIHELFNEYVSQPQPLPLTPTFVESGHPELGLTDFDVFIMESTSQQSRSELDQYLEESLLPRVHEFDVLGWWKINKTKYPTLSKMARDILTIPICTVDRGSVFSNERRVMDKYRCTMRPETVEAMICAKDWLKSGPNLDSSVKMEFPI